MSADSNWNNGNGKFLATIGGTLLASFIAFSSWWVFIHAPSAYATKEDVRCLRYEIREDLSYIRDRIDRAIERQAEGKP